MIGAATLFNLLEAAVKTLFFLLGLCYGVYEIFYIFKIKQCYKIIIITKDVEVNHTIVIDFKIRFIYNTNENPPQRLCVQLADMKSISLPVQKLHCIAQPFLSTSSLHFAG